MHGRGDNRSLVLEIFEIPISSRNWIFQSLKERSRLRIGNCRNGISIGMDKIAWERVIYDRQRTRPKT